VSRTITFDIFDTASIDKAVSEIKDYAKWVQRKANELAKRLADIGAVNVSLGFARAVYTGEKDITVTVDQQGPNTYAIIASGETVLIVEFGAGVTYGYGHPEPSVDGTAMGPTTYPGQKHAADPKGWWIPGGEHTYGNPPSMTMYMTAKELRSELERIAREVFST
jgi:hypothetical protein